MTLDPRSQRAQLVRELLESSQEVLNDRLDSLELASVHLLTHGALDDERRRAVRRTAHQLISLATFGVPGAADLAARAETLLAAPATDAAEEGAQLAELTQAMRAELRQALLEPPPALPAEGDRPPARVGEAPDVLVVEDDPLLVQLLERALEDAGYSVRAVTNGSAAVAAVDVPPGQRPRLVVLDIDLPALDGFGVLRALADRGLLPHVPVLCLTARASAPDVLSVLTLGAVDHVAKPFSLPVLLARVARAVGLR